jgi:hypothetical protein
MLWRSDSGNQPRRIAFFGVSLALWLSVLVASGALSAFFWLSGSISSMGAALEGKSVRLSSKARLLLAELRIASDELDFQMARADLAAYAKEHFRLAKQVPRALGRVVLFSSAAFGLIELAVGTGQGEVRWTGVACLGLGAMSEGILRGLGRGLERRSETVLRRVLSYSFGGAQTFSKPEP